MKTLKMKTLLCASAIACAGILSVGAASANALVPASPVPSANAQAKAGFRALVQHPEVVRYVGRPLSTAAVAAKSLWTRRSPVSIERDHNTKLVQGAMQRSFVVTQAELKA